MCGLVGMAGNIGAKGEGIFRRMLELDTIRGPHSTGVLHVDVKGETNVFKQVGTPWDLYQYSQCNKLFQPMANVLLGHNRWATKGKINRLNAHPFEFDNIIGAHNGTLKTVYQLDDHTKFDVDSENVYHHMDLNGVYDTIPKLNGAYALTWYDVKEQTINLIRNQERPLFYTFSKDMGTLVWASEPWMIKVAMEHGEMEHGVINLLPVDTLHTFEVPFGFSNVIKPFEKTRIRPLEGLKEKKVVVTTSLIGKGTSKTLPFEKRGPALGKTVRSFGEYQKYVHKPCFFYVSKAEVSASGQHFIQCWHVDDDDIQVRVFPIVESDLWRKLMASTNYFQGTAKAYNCGEGGYLTVDIRSVIETDINNCDVPPDDEPEYFGFEKEMINKGQWAERTKKGCAWCASPLQIIDHEEIAWVSKSDCVCPDCAVSPEVTQYLQVENN